jgi:hypothetical protein
MTYGFSSIEPIGVRLIPEDHVTPWTRGMPMKTVWDKSSAIVRTNSKKTDFFLILTATLTSGNIFP